MSFEVRAFGGGLGAEVLGVDLAACCDDTTIAALKQCMLSHQLLVVRDQQLAGPALARFARWWGDLDQDRAHPSLPDSRDVIPIANDEKAGYIDIGHYWHADGVFQQRKIRYSILFAVAVPPTGGETLFCNAYAAHDRLPSELRSLMAGRRAVHLNKNEVPFFVLHPESRRRTLYVNLGGMVAIRGMSLAQASAVREALDRFLGSEDLIYAHTYQPGDLVIHDAFAVLHRAVPPPQSGLRINHRATVLAPPSFELEEA